MEENATARRDDNADLAVVRHGPYNSRSRPMVAIFGGINLDIHGSPTSAEVDWYASNPGRVWFTPGGVGRNIAETIARLGCSVRIAGVVGDDPWSDVVIRRTGSCGVDTEFLERVPGATVGTYLCVNDVDGETIVAVADMELADRMDDAWVRDRADLIYGAGLVIVDTNLPKSGIRAVIELSNAGGTPVLVEPVSPAKAEKLLGIKGRVDYWTPSADEAARVAHRLDLKAGTTIVTRGTRGVAVLSGADGAARLIAPQRVVPTESATGAGDGFVGGLAAAMDRGYPLEDAIRVGMATAETVVRSAETVPSDLSWDRVVGREEM